MKRIKIFCEGVTDQIFISDCLEIFYGIQSIRSIKKVVTKNGKEEERIEIKFDTNCEIIEVGGCNKLSNPIYLAMLEDNTELDGINIVIFDADYTEKQNGNKGFGACVQKLENIKNSHKVSFCYHIWPNHQIDGIIESLLMQLIPPLRKPVFDCIESHQACLRALNLDQIRYSESKDKIGHYLYTSLQDSEAKKRNYKDPYFWNLNIENIQDLKTLKTFFDSYFN